MPMFEGTFNIEEIYKGDVTVPEAYRGPEQVFPFAQAPVPTPGGDGTISTVEGSTNPALAGGHTYVCMVEDSRTSSNITYEVQNVAVSSQTFLGFADTVRLPSTSSSNKETYSISYNMSGTVYGSSYSGALDYDNQIAWSTPEETGKYRYRYHGVNIPATFNASYSYEGETPPSAGTLLASGEGSITVTFSQPVRLCAQVWNTGNNWLTRLPNATMLAGRLYLPAVEFTVNRSIDSVPCDNYTTYPLDFTNALPDSPAEGGSIYSLSVSGSSVIEEISQQDWEDVYKGKLELSYSGIGQTIYNSQYYPRYFGLGLWNNYDLGNKARKDTSVSVIGEEYMDVQEMYGKQYTNEPVWLFTTMQSDGTPNLNALQLLTYERMKAILGDAFTEQEYPPIAYISYYCDVDDNNYTWNMITDCQYNPAGVVS